MTLEDGPCAAEEKPPVTGMLCAKEMAWLKGVCLDSGSEERVSEEGEEKVSHPFSSPLKGFLVFALKGSRRASVTGRCS